ncbi:molybdenum cofactor biosynthesis protein [Eubacterium sp. An11]|uniref:MOSC domain-containing protein n=1 Tax=Eubacterium sp. An11 TaxID=1965542 RepID=UPI000B3747DE|nr:MOSC domain-containing protein [Eubacterium sp. An11]OUQ68967.1 molybdenum cofactor biosynthesis protein [Eubacterium sp. An11]
MGIIRGICISERRGTRKTEVPEAKLKRNWGIEGDAHGGNWHRQVSLLSLEKIKEFREKGADVDFGAFGENLIVEGFDFSSLPVGSRFRIGDAELEMTQIGKECHSHCAIYQTMGDCIMPREGVFAEVRKPGRIRVGDEILLLPEDPDRQLTAAVITLSDKGAAGQREDKSGPVIVEELQKAGYKVIETLLLPDDMEKIKAQLIRLSDQRQVNLILTTGGTGFSERDCTPEATLAVATRNAPGIAEAIRAGSMQITRRAMLSREASVIRHKTLIVNLPGSPKAVKECLDLVLDQLDHGIRILTGRDKECARK